MFEELSSKSPMYGVMYYVGVATGLRIGDILRLRLCDFGLDGMLRVMEQKTSKIKILELPPKLLKLVNEFADAQELDLDEPLFPISRQTALAQIKKAAKKIGISADIGTHSMRKTYA